MKIVLNTCCIHFALCEIIELQGLVIIEYIYVFYIALENYL